MERALSVFAPLDGARRTLLRAFGPWARSWLVDRERRVAISFSFVVLTSLVLASVAPLLLLALGPIFLGVPHLFADVRYLVVREGLHKRAAVWGAVFAPIVGLAITADARWGWAAVVGAALVARGSVLRRLLLAASGVALFVLATRYVFVMGLAVAHLHNLFAIFAVWMWRPKRERSSIAPLVLFLLASAFVLTGAYAPICALAHGDQARFTGLDLSDQASTFAPVWALSTGVRWVVFYAFAQSVHYGIWLRIVPEEARPSKTPRSYSQSVRALVTDLGAPLLAVAVLLALGLAAWAAFDLLAARENYFRFAMFHGYLELAAFTLFFCEGSLRRGAGAVRDGGRPSMSPLPEPAALTDEDLVFGRAPGPSA